MKSLPNLFENNRRWSASVSTADPNFFTRLSMQQAPEFLWIGCSDSRVPANEIVGLAPGELFVHRNVANLVVHSDMNCLSVIQYAVESLKVKHIIVCGHYGCGGVAAALQDPSIGLIYNWLGNIRDIYRRREAELTKISNESERMDRLCEFNVTEQVINVGRTTIVQEAWSKGKPLCLHGWIYGIRNGLLRDLNVSAESHAELLALEKSLR